MFVAQLAARRGVLHHRAMEHVQTIRQIRQAPAVTRRSTSAGAMAVGALALGAFAIGVLAIGRLAIGALRLKSGHARSLTVDNLQVGRLHVRDLIVDRELTHRTVGL